MDKDKDHKDKDHKDKELDEKKDKYIEAMPFTQLNNNYFNALNQSEEFVGSIFNQKKSIKNIIQVHQE